MRYWIAILSLLVTLGLSTGAQASKPVNINRANAATIATSLDGIGLAKARAIVAWRTRHGAFKQAGDLARVKGIGLHTVQRNRSNIRLTGNSAKPSVGRVKPLRKH